MQKCLQQNKQQIPKHPLIKNTLPIIVVYAFLFSSVGLLASQKGFNIFETFLMALIIYASPLQIIMMETINSQTDLISIALLTMVVNYRFIVMSTLILKYTDQKNRLLLTPLLFTLSASSFIAIWAARDSHAEGEINFSYALPLHLILYVASILFTLIGFLYVVHVPASLQQAVLFILPVYFTISMAKKFRDKIIAALVIVGFILTPLFIHYLNIYGLILMPFLLAGLIMLGKWFKERAQTSVK